jgi:hypothetical protein
LFLCCGRQADLIKLFLKRLRRDVGAIIARSNKQATSSKPKAANGSNCQRAIPYPVETYAGSEVPLAKTVGQLLQASRKLNRLSMGDAWMRDFQFFRGVLHERTIPPKFPAK